MNQISRPRLVSPPRHIAIIMDGNGRWARARGMPRSAGHRNGAKALKRTIEATADLGIQYLTVFGFSTENWRRPADEVAELMSLMRFYLRKEITSLHDNGVRLRVIGDRTRLDGDIVEEIARAEELTRPNCGLQLTVAISYGGRHEITQVTQQIAKDVLAGRLRAADIDESMIAVRLQTSELPDPDLVIRTSGERRISNFLLWQAAYAEFIFVDTLWPDFSRADLEQAIAEFHRRERRFGTTALRSEPVISSTEQSSA